MRASLRSGGMAVALLLAWSSLVAAQIPLRINTAAAQIRKFQDITVGGGVIDNFKYTYFVEQVNCNSTIRPVNLQVEFAP